MNASESHTRFLTFMLAFVCFGLLYDLGGAHAANYTSVEEAQARQLELENIIEDRMNGLPVELWEHVEMIRGIQPPWHEYLELQELITIIETMQQEERDRILREQAERAAAAEAAAAEEQARLEEERRQAAEAAAEAARIQGPVYNNTLWNITQHWSPHVGISLDAICLRMIQYDVPTTCPSYEELRVLDNSYPAFDHWYRDRHDVLRRDLHPSTNPASYYAVLDILDPDHKTMHITVDPLQYEVQVHPHIIITQHVPEYLHKPDLRWDTRDRTMPIFHQVHISADCQEALVGSDVWQDVIYLVVHELRTRCTTALQDVVVADIIDAIHTSNELYNLTDTATIELHKQAGQTQLEFDHSYTHTADTKYAWPEYSEAQAQVEYWEKMAKECGQGWRVC